MSLQFQTVTECSRCLFSKICPWMEPTRQTTCANKMFMVRSKAVSQLGSFISEKMDLNVLIFLFCVDSAFYFSEYGDDNFRALSVRDHPVQATGTGCYQEANVSIRMFTVHPPLYVTGLPHVTISNIISILETTRIRISASINNYCMYVLGEPQNLSEIRI